MQLNTHIEFANAEAERRSDSASPARTTPDAAVSAHAGDLARGLAWLPSENSSHVLYQRHRAVTAALRPVLPALEAPLSDAKVSDDFRWLHDNVRLLYSELDNNAEPLKLLRKLPFCRTPAGAVVPRIVALAEGYLAAADCQFREQTFASYVTAFEASTTLTLEELWAVAPVLKLVLLDQIATRSSRVISDRSGSYGAGACVRSLRDIGQTSWKDVLEPLILLDRVLREDPAGAYARMDFDSRDLYRTQILKLAKRSDVTEMEVATQAVALARAAQKRNFENPRVAARQTHVGYYLLEEGASTLCERIGYKPRFGQRVQSFLRKHPDEYYLAGIEIITLAIVLAIILPLVGTDSSLSLILFAALVVLLPASQSAVRLANYLTTSILVPRILPKLDFSEGIPSACVTLVAVPSLLVKEDQVRRLVDDLEVRFLANHDPNIHFALVSDLPDSSEPAPEDDPRVALCAELIDALNEKYRSESMGSFLLLHRHRVYNPREQVWMGWERKRGKLLDLNKLLRNEYDSFPVKVGDLSVLQQVRFVITLDSDTELPRGSAHRMIGALAHPLNQAIIDANKNIVTAGYGILQPRVGVSVQSAARSRLASIYSGETGLDIYTRAVSDVYQDLYGEGIFAGKGIYEVDTLYQVLDRRFPRNALLSHDLIEGAYARAGLLTDVEIIEDYPSHYSAYNRRKHRWLRGDWQIAGWLASLVPDESGRRVPNPISLISKWKILDNLRRSLVEPATFLLLVLGWLALPRSATYWTVAAIVILFGPSWFQFMFNLIRAAVEGKHATARAAVDEFFSANISVFLALTFLAHQTLLSLDAVVRTLVRRIVTRRRLLQWETAAEAELGAAAGTPVDIYLRWIPFLALGLGALVWLGHRNAPTVAGPILLLWAASKFVSNWLNRPPRELIGVDSERDRWFLRRSALRIWRYFAEFSTAEHNWLVPDNVQEEPLVVAPRISPTNLGLLLNARQVACEFGYLTLAEFTDQTLRTLETTTRLQRHKGHLLNWYDTRTLAPLSPRFVSSVDSGNLVASLWTLEQGALERLARPILEPCLADGLLDHLRILVELRALPRRLFRNVRQQTLKNSWLPYLLALPDTVFDNALRKPAAPKNNAQDTQWFAEQARLRLEKLRQTVRSYAPWWLPEFASLRGDPALNLQADNLPLEKMPDLIETLHTRLRASVDAGKPAEQSSLQRRLQALLPEARARVVRLIEDLRMIAANAGDLANQMDFRGLLEPRRKLLSVGFDVESGKLYDSCYDLLATESRIAVFVAIAQDHIPQETWFLMGRGHTVYEGRPVLLSWTGTMFEYLMPGLWMQTYPNTLLDRSRIAAVRSQQAYTSRKGIPWGISESSYFKTDEAGNYQYRAFGVPNLASYKFEESVLVISPYSSFLALTVDVSAALRNLRHMARDGWSGPYGFYEAADFTPSRRRSRFHRYELVRCWMTHHHAMSLLSIANLMQRGIVQKWFHSEPRVQATELLLHEKPVSHVRPVRTSYETLAS
jgi:cyclic beta-1,2-glucan synthetase